MPTFTLPNGDELVFDEPVTAYEVTETIGEGLARAACVAEVNGELVDLNRTLTEDADFKVYTFDDEEGKEVFWHSTAHILGQAVLRVFPDAHITIGPPIEDGFYYDIDHEPFDDDDLARIEEEMHRVVDEDLEIKRHDITIDEAREKFSSNPYKQELLDEIEAQGETHVSTYEQGEFEDLCRGPHIQSTGKIKALKVLKSSGAYWRGNEENEQLQRIYGTSYPKKKLLKQYLERLEEAKKRDHKKLGKQLGIYTQSPKVGKGLPLFKPNGAIIRDAITDYLWDLHKHRGYQKITTPHITKWDLYETSGHADKFGDELFTVEGKDSEFVLKPMNCPHHTQIYDDDHHSYRDLPIRYFEPGIVYRDEQSGELSGLLRVRHITQDDGHLFCTVDQIEEEVGTVVEIIKEFYETLGMMDDYWVSLSVRGPDKTKYLGGENVWDAAEHALENAAENLDLPYKRVEGEAAFYGPKLDFMFRDALSREWQLATVQADFNLPERFDLTYDDEDGEKTRPVMIHRAITGSLERFMGVMIEHFKGEFPLWMSPEQVRVITITDRNNDYADTVVEQLRSNDVRVKTDYRSESVGKKIREAELDKAPYVLVIGDNEEENESVNVRHRDSGVIGEMTTERFVEAVTTEFKNKELRSSLQKDE